MLNFKEEFANCLLKVIDLDNSEILKNISTPPDFNLGNFSFPCFFLSSQFKKAPKDIAKEISSKLSSDIFQFSEINGYINATIVPEILYQETIPYVLENKKNYGKSTGDNKQILIDTFNVNPFKALHIGHLRMIVGGNAIDRLLSFSGRNPISIYYGGDVGTHVSKWYWYYSKYLTKEEQEVPKEDVSKWFGKIYVAAGKKAKEVPTSTLEIDEVQKKILTDPSFQKIIRELRDKSFEAYMHIKEELEINLNDKIFESETEERFLEIKEELFSKHKNIFIESENAMIADLKKYSLDVLVLIKQNGAPLYAAKDISLVSIKKEKHPNANNFLYVVGSEQNFYLKQMFQLFSLIYPNTEHKHLSLGMVNQAFGKMASREDGMILYEDFRELLKEKVIEILTNNGLEICNDTVSKIVFGTLKFEMLKINFNKDFVFDITSALNLQGDTSVYIQYSGVRAKSILRKINDASLPKKLNLLDDEKKLLYLIYLFPTKVLQAANEHKPNIIANYCLELSHQFNKFYVNCPVILSEQELQNQRLLLVKAYLQCLENALDLLGIKVPEKM